MEADGIPGFVSTIDFLSFLRWLGELVWVVCCVTALAVTQECTQIG